MNTKSLRARLGRMACVSLLVAGCATPDGGSRVAALWSRFQPRSRSAELAKSARELDVKDPATLHLAYGRWREQVGDLDDARVSYESVLREDPRHVDALVGLARIDHLAGRHDEAERRLNKALQEAPGSARVLAAQGQFYAAQNRWTEAVEKLNEAVLAAPATAEYRYQLAVALARSGDPDAALPHFAKTVGAAEAHYNIGYILHEQGRTREAERHLVEALRQRPDLHVAETLLAEMRDGRARLTAPPVVAADSRSQPPWAAAEPTVSQTAMATERMNRFAPNAAPSARPGDSSPFFNSPFADSASTASAGRGSERFSPTARNPFAGSISTASIGRGAVPPSPPPASSWYPTTSGRPDDGLTAAQREQMFNQRWADSSAFSDGPVRR